MKELIWVFQGERSNFPSGVFFNKDLVFQEIKNNRLSGILTGYPANEFVYFWAIKNNLFEVKTERQKSSEFIGTFNSASQQHYHFKDGEQVA